MAQEQPKKISKPIKNVNLDKLGLYLDGWADLAEGMGSKVDDARKEVIRSLAERNMPDIRLEKITGGVSLSKEKRQYLTAETSPGVTTTVNISKHGHDLYASWRTYWKATINWLLLWKLAYIAWGFSGLWVIFNYLAGIYAAYQFLKLSTEWIELWQRMVGTLAEWVAWTVGIYLFSWVFLEILIPKLYTLITKKHWDHDDPMMEIIFFVSIGAGLLLSEYVILFEGVNFVWETFSTTIARYHTSLEQFLRNAMVIFIPGLVIMAGSGWVLQNQIFYYFFVQPSVFDQEDIVAMSLSVHNSILRSLDSVGIDVSKLRLKRDFNSGRRGEKI